ncbi:DUF1772 domain-containing protein [Flagellimonas sp. S3867]|uniref:anthrone oxygenase family protein n=1 Tax=Flagellimonas sp. S3867 TaxID=2768063 RepID=UPI0016883EE2|nr:DUF1772 domain-containing protein [Flagellimonas sp. S3867]
MDWNLETIVMLITTILTGLTAGLCFTWTNAITPGIGLLDDQGFLRSFQQMNRAIINPTFLLVFLGPFFTHLLNVFLHRGHSSTTLVILIIAATLYTLGVVVVTVFGNVPLNEMLDKIDLSTADTIDLQTFREQFEGKWNRLHMIRTICSLSSFILLVLLIGIISKP